MNYNLCLDLSAPNGPSGRDLNRLTIQQSRGLGAVLCEKFAAEGCNIVTNYVAAEQAAKQVVEACKKHGIKAVAIQAVCI